MCRVSKLKINLKGRVYEKVWKDISKRTDYTPRIYSLLFFVLLRIDKGFVSIYVSDKAVFLRS